jgi:hypothetical protein
MGKASKVRTKRNRDLAENWTSNSDRTTRGKKNEQHTKNVKIDFSIEIKQYYD